MSDGVKWRARSANDKDIPWPFWYVTDDSPVDRNKTKEAVEMLGLTASRDSLPFLPEIQATFIARMLNEKLEGKA